MFSEYLFLEFFLISAAGFSLFSGTKGILLPLGIMTGVNYLNNYPESFSYWEIFIILFALSGFLINLLLDKKTCNLRVLKVTAGSGAFLLSSGIFLPLVLGFIFWFIFIGIPLVFTYREISRAFYLQIIFKFIFSTGWLIIGNILY